MTIKAAILNSIEQNGEKQALQGEVDQIDKSFDGNNGSEDADGIVIALATRTAC